MNSLIPEPTEAQNDKEFRIRAYGWCKYHNCTGDECGCWDDARDILAEQDNENEC